MSNNNLISFRISMIKLFSISKNKNNNTFLNSITTKHFLKNRKSLIHYRQELLSVNFLMFIQTVSLAIIINWLI